MFYLTYPYSLSVWQEAKSGIIFFKSLNKIISISIVMDFIENVSHRIKKTKEITSLIRPNSLIAKEINVAKLTKYMLI